METSRDSLKFSLALKHCDSTFTPKKKIKDQILNDQFHLLKYLTKLYETVPGTTQYEIE